MNLCSLCLFARNRVLHEFLFNIAEFGAKSEQNQEALEEHLMSTEGAQRSTEERLTSSKTEHRTRQ